jgi:16S rRNA (uracil1498-N3)-methyltransferase
MRTSRLFTEQALSSGQSLLLSKESSHYLSKVLRLREGSVLRLFNGRDGEFLARLAKITKHEVEVEIAERLIEPKLGSLKIDLYLGLSKGDRMDYGIQKSTELGVASITPFYSQHSGVKLKEERVENRLRHWQQIAVSASEQCGRLDVPLINEPLQLSEWLDSSQPSVTVVIDPNGDTNLSDLPTSNSINLLVGPEGGFAEEELLAAKKSGCTIAVLGSRILRTETAPIAALAILQHLYGDL